MSVNKEQSAPQHGPPQPPEQKIPENQTLQQAFQAAVQTGLQIPQNLQAALNKPNFPGFQPMVVKEESST